MVRKSLFAALLAGALGTMLLQAAPAPGDGGDGAAATATASAGINAFTPLPASSGVDGFFQQSFRSSDMQGSLDGTPGLWNTRFAETLAPGQASSGVYLQRYTRNPGAMVFTDADMGWTVGVTRWLELSFATNSYRRVRLNNPNQLTFAQTGTLNNFNPVAPFARNPLLVGPVDYSFGATIGLLSQDRGDKFGLALQFVEHLPYNADYGTGVVHYGVGTTEPEFEDNVLIDKWLGSAGELVANLGYQHNGTADPGGKVNLPLRDQFNWGFGEIFPRYGRLQGIVEVNGNAPFGAGVHSNFYGPTSPIDGTYGIRYNPLSWMGLNAAYRLGDARNANNSGFVFGLSFGPAAPRPLPPPPAPVTPTLACNASPATVEVGASVHISSTVSPANLPFTYDWTTTGGRVQPAQSQADVNTAGLAPGMYTVTVRANNGSGGTANCQSSFEVREKPRNPPTASCQVNPTSPVRPGAMVTFTGTGNSPDERPLTYAWQTSAGRLDSTSQATAHLDTTGMAPGNVNATLTVTDDRGLSATCSSRASIEAPPPPPQAALATTLAFKANSARVDNAAKAALDDVALRLQQDGSAKAVIVGFATSTEGKGKPLTPEATTKLAEERAVNAKAYLVTDKGIAADRIEVRQDNSPEKAEVWVVPQGASYSGAGQTFDENAVKPAKVKPARTAHSSATSH